MPFNFDSNKWYQVTVDSFNTLSLASTGLDPRGVGAFFFQNTNTSSKNQQWQFFPADGGTYVMRSKQAGATSYVTTGVGNSSDADNTGDTVPSMRNYTLSDKSMYWTVGTWNDGTYYFTNNANGTDWHLDVGSNALMAMSSNITTSNKDGQSFSFTEIGDINSQPYSSLKTVATPTATVAPNKNTNAASTATPNSDSSSSGGGLTTGAKAAIGASIGGVVFIALLIGVFLLMRHSKKSRDARHKEMESKVGQGTEYAPLPQYQAYQPASEQKPRQADPTGPAELGAPLQGTHVQPVEAEARPASFAAPVELPASPPRER